MNEMLHPPFSKKGDLGIRKYKRLELLLFYLQRLLFPASQLYPTRNQENTYESGTFWGIDP